MIQRYSRKVLGLVLSLMIFAGMVPMQGCGPNDLHKLHTELNLTAKSLNAAAKTSHQFYESGIYGPVGSAHAIEVRQRAAKAIHDANEFLIQALNLAKQLTPETFEQGKLAVLQALAQAAGVLHTGNQSIDLVLQGVAALINNAVILIQAFKSADLRYVIPRIQSWQVAEVVV
jgi:hypothetical protein